MFSFFSAVPGRRGDRVAGEALSRGRAEVLLRQAGGGLCQRRAAQEVLPRRQGAVTYSEFRHAGTGRGVRSATGLGWLRFGMFHHPDGQ